ALALRLQLAPVLLHETLEVVASLEQADPLLAVERHRKAPETVDRDRALRAHLEADADALAAPLAAARCLLLLFVCHPIHLLPKAWVADLIRLALAALREIEPWHPRRDAARDLVRDRPGRPSHLLRHEPPAAEEDHLVAERHARP